MNTPAGSARLRAGLIAGLIFALGAAAGVAGDRALGGRSRATPTLPPLTVRDMASALDLDPAQRARVATVLDSLRPEIASAAAQGTDSLRSATQRARGRIAEVLPPARRDEFQRWLDARHAHMMEMMRRMGPGMMGPGTIGPGPMRGGGMAPGSAGSGGMGGGMMGRGMGGGMMGRTPSAAPRSRAPAPTRPEGPATSGGLPAPEGPGARLVASQCSLCHQTPSPALHAASDWPAVLRRMRGHMQELGIGSLTDAQADTVLRYLERYAGG